MTGEETGEEKGKISRAILAVIILSGIAVMAIHLKQPVTYPYTSVVAGVNVHSQIPISEIQYLKNIALFNNSNKAATTCNFELYAISTVDRYGYRVFIEKGEKGIYVQRNAAYIKGNTDREILQACNVFSCIREGIECPENLWEIRDIIVNSKRINVILDINLKGPALRGYGDVLGALGYIQGENVLRDMNGDGRIEKWEVEENLIKIFPHIKEDNECKLQPISTALQKLNATNETFNCSGLHPSIMLTKAEKNAIEVKNGDVIISGDDDHIGSACIILRDVISPEFIRSLYRMG
ncbi:MAG: hypothetical protein B6U86_04570 [Candidatus Altiarchaeales archaeon ex4484_43]|nr:MAG: hypothetical protein B6U86_04570 [Candidatus Altiarchaeales archaeon ex4484_43]